MSDDGLSAGVPQDRPDFVACYVVEVDIAHDREGPLFASIRGPFASEERAERERDVQEAVKRACENRIREDGHEDWGVSNGD